MTILDRLLSALGLGGGHATDRDTAEPTDTVEYEPDASDEAAVKGVDAGATAESDGAPEAAGEPTGTAETSDATEATGATGTPDEGPEGESVETVKGIGPAYAGRLGAAGVGTVADLAEADADDLAERTSLSAKRVGRWIERARERRET